MGNHGLYSDRYSLGNPARSRVAHVGVAPQAFVAAARRADTRAFAAAARRADTRAFAAAARRADTRAFAAAARRAGTQARRRRTWRGTRAFAAARLRGRR